MNRLLVLMKSWRVLFVLAALLVSLIAISPHPGISGAAILQVESGSAADIAGMSGPKAKEAPTSRERVLSVNGQSVADVEAYHQVMQNVQVNDTLTIATNKGTYRVRVLPATVSMTLPELEEIVVQENSTENRTMLVNRTVERVIGVADIGLKVAPPASTNIRRGLDLQGGTRVLMQPETALPKEDMELLIAGMKERLNVFGLSDIVVREAADLGGNSYVMVEVAGVNEDAVRELLANQGKFEAKVTETVIFRGGKDIVDVCKSATCAGIDPQQGCGSTGSGWACRFRFSITLAQEAAVRQHETIRDLPLDPASDGTYLSEDIDLYLDDVLVDSLRIGADLRNAPVSAIQISGSGEGANRDLAVQDAIQSMQRLQTILITGSLPVKMEIVQAETISPVLGDQFARNALVIALAAMGAVALIIFALYRSVKVALPIVFISLSEIVIMLGIAAMIKWNIDLAAVAGIIAAVGTGVNDQIIITDEALRGELRHIQSWKDKIKRAFFVIMGAYLTTVVAMLPLLFAGAGLLRGFALITIIGVSVGVFLTRPAYAKAVEVLLK